MKKTSLYVLLTRTCTYTAAQQSVDETRVIDSSVFIVIGQATERLFVDGVGKHNKIVILFFTPVTRPKSNQAFEYFNKEVTKESCFQVKEAYSVSQDLLSVLDGECSCACACMCARICVCVCVFRFPLYQRRPSPSNIFFPVFTASKNVFHVCIYTYAYPTYFSWDSSVRYVYARVVDCGFWRHILFSSPCVNKRRTNCLRKNRHLTTVVFLLYMRSSS